MSDISKFCCDVCGKEIASVTNGYVIWRTNDDQKAYDFKIIHQKSCDLKETHKSSSPLSDFLGVKGLSYLLSFLSIGKIKTKLGQTDSCRILDMTEFVDFVRRLQTPFYETARGFFGDSNLLDDFYDSNEINPYFPETLEKISKRYE